MSHAAAQSGRLASARDLSSPRLLRGEAPLAMPEQNFGARGSHERRPGRRESWVPRAAVFIGALLLTLAFAYELHGVLAISQMTPFQSVFLVLSTISFGWIAFGSLSAAMGFLPLFAGESADSIRLPCGEGTLTRRTALLFPVYHEDPARIAGAITAMVEELEALGGASAFDAFILSDTRSAEAGAEEEAAYATLIDQFAGAAAIYYRRRAENGARKAGNIKDWVERFGGDYAHFVILDGDSVMSGRTLVRLALAMEENSEAGLIQTVPRLIGGTTVLQKLQQFASNVYGPAVATGLAFWHRDEGNYWGHNAIIRTAAFAGAAGLPELPGPAPFGGHIQSHDFVEAVLLQRAGWGVHMAPTLDGSYEGLPPSLVDVVIRDRRWAQGNLQHLSIVPAAGLTAMGRVHLLMGAFSYLVSAIWAASLAVGIVLALQGQQILPSYFTDSKTLFPIWPVIDPGAALRLFMATMFVVLLPKVLGLVLEIKRVRGAREVGGTPRAVAGVATETLFSMLFAPILMITQTVAVFQILLGRDSGWKVQRRDDGPMSLAEARRFHWRHMVAGVILAALCWQASPGLLVWTAPVILGLILSIPLSWITARPAGPVLSFILATAEDRAPPAVLTRVQRQTGAWAERIAGINQPLRLPRAA